MEVVATLFPSNVFVAGQTVNCRVVFRRCKDAANSIDRNASNNAATIRHEQVNLAWASVQLSCECIVGGKKATESSVVSKATSFAAEDWLEGSKVISLPPKLLFCDLKLGASSDCGAEAEAARSFLYREVIPADAPPSYRGKFVKVCYNLIVATQRINSKVEVVKVPFRVLCAPPPSPRLALAASQAMAAEERYPISNPFLPEEGDSVPINEVSINGNLSRESSFCLRRRKPLHYKVASSQGHIATITLMRDEVKLGEDILVAVDLSRASVSCLQYSACLLSKESVVEPAGEHRQEAHARAHEFCLGLAESSLTMEVPSHLTPSFETAACSLEWLLLFRFVVSSEPALSLETAAEWQGARRMHVQTLSLEVPLTVLSADPAAGKMMMATAASNAGPHACSKVFKL